MHHSICNRKSVVVKGVKEGGRERERKKERTIFIPENVLHEEETSMKELLKDEMPEPEMEDDDEVHDSAVHTGLRERQGFQMQLQPEQPGDADDGDTVGMMMSMMTTTMMTEDLFHLQRKDGEEEGILEDTRPISQTSGRRLGRERHSVRKTRVVGVTQMIDDEAGFSRVPSRKEYQQTIAPGSG